MCARSTIAIASPLRTSAAAPGCGGIASCVEPSSRRSLPPSSRGAHQRAPRSFAGEPRCLAICVTIRSELMSETATRAGGLLVAALYGATIAWLYVRQPQTMAHVTGGLASAIGSYHIDQQAFADGVAFF